MNIQLVSIIVPCYNQAEFLDEALESVLEQTYSNWECIVVNDGSSDNTDEVAKKWVEKDKRFKYLYQENGGLSSARNFGIERSTGIYILPLDADDYISSNYIEACVQEMESKDLKLVYGKVEQFGIRTGEWDFGSYSYNNLLVSNTIHCTALYRKSDWESVGGYDEAMIYGLEDWEFWVQILNEKDQVLMLETITFFYRIKDVSMITLMDKQKEYEAKEYVFNKHVSKYFLPFTEISLENKLLKQNMNKTDFVFKRFLKLILKIKY